MEETLRDRRKGCFSVSGNAVLLSPSFADAFRALLFETSPCNRRVFQLKESVSITNEVFLESNTMPISSFAFPTTHQSASSLFRFCPGGCFFYNSIFFSLSIFV